MALDIEITKISPSTYNVKLSGMLDTQAAPIFDSRMEPVLSDTGLRNIILELPDLTFISSMGMGSIATIRRTLAANRGSVVIIRAKPQIARIIDIVKVLPREAVFETRKEADKYLAAIQKQLMKEHSDAQQQHHSSGNA
jgi:anti-anti-sigma factor